MRLAEVLRRAQELAPGATLEVPYYEWPLAELSLCSRDGALAHESAVSVQTPGGVVYVARGREPGRLDVAALRKWIAEQHTAWEVLK